METLTDRWELLEEVGRGGQAVTFLGRDITTDIPVAVKILSLRRVDNWKALELFQREGEILQHLDHPAIPRYVDAFEVEIEDQTRFVLVQEFVEGKTLEEMWTEHEGHPVFCERKTLRFLKKMLEVLRYLHDHRPPVVHRDIKPGNIFERPDGSFALVDFGAVQAVIPGTMGGSTFIGTSGYMAPEQLLGRAEPRSDLFALGATAIQLLSGFHPGDLPVRAMRIEFDSVVSVSDEVQRFLEKLVAPNPGARFSSAADALAALPRPARPTEVAIRERMKLGKLQILATDDEATVRFPLSTAHPWTSITAATATVASLAVLGFITTINPIMQLLGVAGLFMFIISLSFTVIRPQLHLGPTTWTLRRRRLLAPDLSASGRTQTLVAQTERRTVVNWAGVSERQKWILVLRDGLEEELVVLGDDDYSALSSVLHALRDNLSDT